MFAYPAKAFFAGSDGMDDIASEPRLSKAKPGIARRPTRMSPSLYPGYTHRLYRLPRGSALKVFTSEVVPSR